MSKKYCIFAAQYLPHMGGVERYTYNLAKHLIERGNQVVVVTSNCQQLPEYEVMEGIEVYRLPCINLLDGRYPVLKFWTKDFRRLRTRLKKEVFSLVIVNTRFYLHSVFGVRFGKRTGTKTIVIDHGTSHLSVHNKVLDTVGATWEHLITRIDYHYCREYYGVSMATNDWLKHFHINAKGTLYNAIDLSAIEEIKNHLVEDYRQKYHIPEDAIIIAFTGRLLEEKGIFPLIKAFETIQKKHNNTYMFIAGDGDLEDYVKEHESRNLIYLGRLEFENVIAMLSASDIFCLPSFSEGFSTSVLEAVACGCYVVTTERGGSKELIINKEYGTIIKNNEYELVKNALLECVDGKVNYQQAARKSYQRLKENYTWDIVADEVIKITEKS